MASTVATTNDANERDAATTARTVGGLLAIHGIQSQTVGNEQAWGRTPTEVSTIFYFLHFNFCIIYLLAFKKIYKIQKMKYDKTTKIFIPLSYVI